MRVNAIHQSEETTAGTIYENVVLSKRTTTSGYNANETNLGNYTYRPYPSPGYYKEGFVQYLPGNMSLQQTLTRVASLVDAGWFSAGLETFTAEVMVYNYNLKYGIVFAITFGNSNSGVVRYKITENIFVTEVYDLTLSQTQIKVAVMILWMLIIVVLLCSFFKTLLVAMQVLWTSRRLDLNFYDLVNCIQIFLGIAVFCFYFNLFFSHKHHHQFKIPFESETDF